MEKYISVTKFNENTNIQFIFIDSCRFLSKLLMRKVVFPYDYIDNFERLNETQLPPKKALYNKLNDVNITDEDYIHAKQVFTIFNCKFLGDYLNLYLKTDIHLLADVFEQFRKSSLMEYGLDSAWYFTLPRYTWACNWRY